MKNKIYLALFSGMGDLLINKGLINYYSKLYKEINLFIFKDVKDFSKLLFKDINNLNLIIYPDNCEDITEIQDFIYSTIKNNELLYIGLIETQTYLEENPNVQFDEAIYNLAKVPFIKRFDDFTLIENKKEQEKVYNIVNPNNEDYILINEISSGKPIKLPVDKYTQYPNIKRIYNKMGIGPNLFSWLKVIRNAKEIHSLDTGFINLVHSIKLNPTIFYYKYYRTTIKPNNHTKHWISTPSPYNNYKLINELPNE